MAQPLPLAELRVGFAQRGWICHKSEALTRMKKQQTQLRSIPHSLSFSRRLYWMCSYDGLRVPNKSRRVEDLQKTRNKASM